MSDETPAVPRSLRNLRACLKCALVKSMDQFVESGCENCPELNMQGKKGRVEECTSTTFEGLIAMTDPDKSWVARWQGMKPNQAKGMYAIAVYGDVDNL